MNDFDKEILSSPWFLQNSPVCSVPKAQRTHEQSIEVHRLKQLLPYLLRAAALDEKLDPRFFGRALITSPSTGDFDSCANISGGFNRGFRKELPLVSVFWASPQSNLGR